MDYYAVKNNFYFLFEIAERVKKAFYSRTNILRMAVSSTVLICGGNVYLIGHPAVSNTETAGGQVGGAAAAVDDKRLVELAVLIPFALNP